MTKFRQTFANLIRNACKFTDQGEIILDVSRVEDAPTPSIRYRVIDTGIGMDQDQLGHIFDAFTQADSTTTKRFGGTGLGLAISKEYCELMQGSIEVSWYRISSASELRDSICWP